QTAATAAAKIAIELGPPVLWTILAAILLATAVLLRGALKRGRASFYPSLGAACLIAMLLRGFADAKIFAQAVSIVAAATIGLAQRLPRVAVEPVASARSENSRKNTSAFDYGIHIMPFLADLSMITEL